MVGVFALTLMQLLINENSQYRFHFIGQMVVKEKEKKKKEEKIIRLHRRFLKGRLINLSANFDSLCMIQVSAIEVYNEAVKRMNRGKK